MVTSILMVKSPDGSVWKQRGITVEGNNDDFAKEELMVDFCRAHAGESFKQVTLNDAYHFWQMAERNGYSIDTMHVNSVRADAEPPAAQVAA